MVPLGQVKIEALRRRHEKTIAKDMDPELIPLVFPNTTGMLHRTSNFDRRLWHPIPKNVGIPDGFHFHHLRHH